ncbi:MAG: sensor histidine kinase, partial [Chloroflexi bacterium]|nr:sensor histidine kinase [Chloroflexota bacterium]
DDLQEALAQILDNAYRFTPPDGTIEVSVMVENPSINIVVSDTGPGIATEHLPHIFETFWRLDEAHSTPGLGLGLSLARKIIEMHGGSIAVDSVVGEGTTFVLRLPITEY